jgi:putative membrane protein
VLIRLVWVLAANAIALGVTAWLLGDVIVDDWVALLLAAIVFGVVNALVKPVVTILGLPVIIVTLGVALFFINMLMLWLTDAVVGGFDIEGGFWTYVAATFFVWLVNVLLELVPPFKRGQQLRR